jgi:acyl carrier protein
MSPDEILLKVKTMLHDSYSIETEGLDADSKLADLGIDSLLLVNIMLDIETDMGFNFESMDLPPNASLGDVSQAIYVSMNKA